ncbi:MAG TPA: TrbI/VirB10 family protein [Rubrivivax sp.]|nr:TrbI/VirB10 family protein [Rubrivivax sp.]
MRAPFGNPSARLKGLGESLSPRQRQYALLVAILAGGVGLLWMIFASTDSGKPVAANKPSASTPNSVTHIGVMPPGQQVNPLDQWVGTAGNKLAQYESEREEQGRLNKDRQAFEAQTMKRFAELEQRLSSAAQVVPVPAAMPTPAPVPPALVAAPPTANLPPPPLPPAGRPLPAAGMPPGQPPMPLSQLPSMPPVPVLSRVTLAERSAPAAATGAVPGAAAAPSEARTVSTFLPVSFTRGTLLGGLDAPTGGQSQSNPHPVLIRLSDNSVLPNRFRGEYRDCFVVAAGYGDISAERAYLRTESLSCVRADGAALEVRIQGSVYGEDGKVGMRGRLVTKQGQMLANALLAGVVSGIGQGLAISATSYSTSALGTVATASGSDAFVAGLGTGVGKALDRLAQYYIKLAENTFPVIEVDAGREVDVVITRGVRIDVPMAGSGERLTRTDAAPAGRYQEATDDGNY